MPRRRRQGANLYLRGRTWWCWFYDEQGRQQRRSTHQRDRALAEKAAGRIERAFFANAEGPPPLRLEDAFARWLAALEAQGRADETLSYYEKRVVPLLRALGPDTDIHALTLDRMDRYVAVRKATRIGKGEKFVSLATIAKELGALRSCLRYLRRRKAYQGDPEQVMPELRNVSSPKDRALSHEEYGKLLHELRARRRGVADRRDYLVAYVGLGVRESELYRIEASDLRGEMVHCRGSKTRGSDRWIPLRPEVREVLERRAQATPSGPLFPRWTSARRDLLQACQRAGIASLSHNDLRRTFATFLAEAGVPEAVTASLLGHGSSAMCRRVYVRIGAKAQREAIAALPKL